MNRAKTVLRSLSARLALLLTLALLPLGLISLYQTREVIEDAQRVRRNSLMSETVSVTHAGRELIQEALGAAQGLGAAALDLNADRCNAMMAGFVANHSYFSFAGYITPAAQMICNSAAVPLDVSGSRMVATALAEDRPFVDFSPRGTFSGEAVTIASHPVRQDGRVLGLVSVSIPHRYLSERIEAAATSEDLHVAAVNQSGEIVVSTGDPGDARDLLPGEMSPEELVGMGSQTFVSDSIGGERRLYAVDAVLPQSVVLVGSRPLGNSASTVGGLQSGLALAFPIVMWIAGIGVAMLGLQRLVVRHVRSLRSAMRRFALGDRSQSSLTLDDPPEELEEAARAFSRMALIISDAEARQQKDLQDKEVLLREVHHRVKNNLQLIGSIMNMQMRTAESAETRRMLMGLQRRVRGLATLHRTLYTTLDMTTVDGGDIVRAVMHDVAQGALPQGVSLKIDVEPAQLYPDQAVPLSMLAAEALTNALKYVGRPEGGEAQIRVSLTRQEEDSFRLRIANTKGAPVAERIEDPAGTGGLGTKLMQAFVMQIDGTAEVTEDADSYVCDVVFTRRDFDTAPGKRDAA